jgi:hypothetical protein
VYLVNIIESDISWGQRIDEQREFPTKEAALDFCSEFNAKNTNEGVPDRYMRAGYRGWTV